MRKQRNTLKQVEEVRLSKFVQDLRMLRASAQADAPVARETQQMLGAPTEEPRGDCEVDEAVAGDEPLPLIGLDADGGAETELNADNDEA